jgi:hypothetical protein
LQPADGHAGDGRRRGDTQEQRQDPTRTQAPKCVQQTFHDPALPLATYCFYLAFTCLNDGLRGLEAYSLRPHLDEIFTCQQAHPVTVMTQYRALFLGGGMWITPQFWCAVLMLL